MTRTAAAGPAARRVGAGEATSLRVADARRRKDGLDAVFLPARPVGRADPASDERRATRVKADRCGNHTATPEHHADAEEQRPRPGPRRLVQAVQKVEAAEEQAAPPERTHLHHAPLRRPLLLRLPPLLRRV